MGKITEALKKAGKENRLMSLERKEKRPTREKANDAPKDKKMPGQSSRALAEAEKAPKIGNVAVAAKSPAMVEKKVPIVQADSSLNA